MRTLWCFRYGFELPIIKCSCSKILLTGFVRVGAAGKCARESSRKSAGSIFTDK